MSTLRSGLFCSNTLLLAEPGIQANSPSQTYENALPTRLCCLLTCVYYAQLIPMKSVPEFSTVSLSSRDTCFFQLLALENTFDFYFFHSFY